MPKITINIPDGEIRRWKVETLVRVMCEINGLASAWLEPLKAEARQRAGVNGDTLTDGKTRSVTVSKQSAASVKVDYDAIGKYYVDMLTQEEAEQLKARFTKTQSPKKQSVIMR